jgi:small redox-active disulfide protein 2
MAISSIEIYGSGCAKCKELERRVNEAVKKIGLNVPVKHVYEIDKIIEMGILSTPAIAVNGKIKSSGKLLSIEEIVAILKGE